MTAESLSVDELLLVLKIAFLVLLYLFIWRIVRSASRDIRTPRESFVLAPGAPGSFPAPAARDNADLVVVKSPTLRHGERFPLDSAALTIGRSDRNDIELHDDQFASATHARVEPRRDGVWLEDAGSTNGTFVNGVKIGRARKLTGGDVIRVGETDLRFDG